MLRLKASGPGLSEATWLTLDIRVRTESDEADPDDYMADGVLGTASYCSSPEGSPYTTEVATSCNGGDGGGGGTPRRHTSRVRRGRGNSADRWAVRQRSLFTVLSANDYDPYVRDRALVDGGRGASEEQGSEGGELTSAPRWDGLLALAPQLASASAKRWMARKLSRRRAANMAHPELIARHDDVQARRKQLR
eukprot:COSAG05_NODE_317_length_11545_cov_73.981391_2_plen_193_part_00